jgi:hypothetical protein
MKKKGKKPKGECGRKKQENKLSRGRKTKKIEKEKPKWWGKKKKTKRGVSTKWQLNSPAPVEFARPNEMATEMDSAITKFDCYRWMVNKMHYTGRTGLAVAFDFHSHICSIPVFC